MIDLSNNNRTSWLPLTYNFRKAYVEGGQRRAYFKATEGRTFVDRRTPALAKRAKAAGLKVGWYHFANSWDQNPKLQAQFFVKTMPRDYALIPCLDMEQGAPSEQKGYWAKGFTAEVERLTGLYCAIYGSTYYLDVCFTRPKINVTHNPLWIAAVTRTGGPLDFKHVRIPAAWKFDQVAFHQYNWHARVPGIPGECDLSRPIHGFLVDRDAV